MVIGAQGDKIPRVIVIVISIKMVNFNNQVPITDTTFALMINEACCSIVFVGLVVGVIFSGPVKAVVATSAASLLARVFEDTAVGTRVTKLRIFYTF
jgi:hypothetical protein